jgi:purine-binding chemotaxis protein CheW
MDQSTTSAQYCTFWVDGLFFGVAVSEVQEVLRYQQLTAVPAAPEAVKGLINLRGQIVTALDLRTRLGLAVRADDSLPMNVIVRSRGEVVSLLVDDIGDVIDTADLELEATPANVPSIVQDVVIGVLPLPDALLLVLDADRAADVSAVLETTGGNP